EDTRRTAVLMRTAEADTRMVALHSHSEAAREAELVDRMRAGETVALVSDAGMPLVSDPGARLVRAAVAARGAGTAIPGPSAVTTAIGVSGLAEGTGFVFTGFVPRAARERSALIRSLEVIDRPAVLFESPNRLPQLLADLAGEWPDRAAAVCRELTK